MGSITLLSRKTNLAVWLFGIGALLCCDLYAAGDWGGLTIFGQVGYSDAVDGSRESESDALQGASLDVLYTAGNNRFRFMAEYFYNSKDSEKTALQRLQLGWNFSENGTLWLGKVHNPNQYWRDEYHSGLYVSPSVTEPFQSVSVYEGGISAQHLSGLRLDYAVPLSAGKQLEFYGVVADTPNTTGVKRPDVDVGDFVSNRGENRLFYALGVSFVPDVFGNTEIGLRYSQASSVSPELTRFVDPAIRIEQTLASAYASWESGHWRVLLSHTEVTSELNEPITLLDIPGVIAPMVIAVTETLTFDASYSYLHVEHTLSEHWKLFARGEKIAFDASPQSFSILREFQVDYDYGKTIAGIRYDFDSAHALSLQYTDYTKFGVKENMLHVVWSFAFGAGR